MAFLCLPYLSLVRPWALLALLAVPMAFKPMRSVVQGAEGQALIPVLGATGRLEMIYGLLLVVGLAMGS